jgi:acyl-CoA thioesterase FadM
MYKFRLFKLFLRYLFTRQHRDMLRPVTCRFVVTPFEVELTHASSYTYMAYAALGRWSWNLACIDMRRMLRERWTPFTHSELVYYRRAVGMFSIVEMTTTLIWWDMKMAYFEHRMTQGEQVSAIVYSRGACYSGGKRIAINQTVEGAPALPPMAKPAIVDGWAALDAEFKRGQ